MVVFEDRSLLPLVLLFLERYEILVMYPLHMLNGTCTVSVLKLIRKS
jgi:hypothetical protein